MKPDPKDYSAGQIAAALIGVLAVILLIPALGEMQLRQWNHDYAVIFSAMRIWMIVGASALGFVLGWLLSPQASELRAVIGALFCLALIAVAVFNNGLLGWGLATMLAILGFCMALGYWLGRVVKALAEPPTTFGSSHWADANDLREHGLFDEGGIRLGTDFDGETERVISYKGDRHLIPSMITRDGKGTSQIIPNLLTLPNSMLVIDPKGENAMITTKARLEMVDGLI